MRKPVKFTIFVLFAVHLTFAYANPLDAYSQSYVEGWNRFYKHEVNLEKEEIPEPLPIVYHSGSDSSLSLKEQGLIDGINNAGYYYYTKKWNDLEWWQKILHFETWFMVTFII